MRVFRRIVNPFVAFAVTQVAWVLVLVFWIRWFMGRHRALRNLAEQYSPELLDGGLDWFILVEGIVLLAVILAGFYVIFLYWRRQVALYRAQRNFVSQVSHELKSPLASLQLHLETIRLHRPPAEELGSFVDTMLADVDRLHGLISNLLAASRLEQRWPHLNLREMDLSRFVRDYFEERRGFLPEGGRLDLDLEDGLQARIDPETLEVAFRNLLENAVLYAEGPPEVRVQLRCEGRFAHLVFSDRGRGIPSKDRRKVFEMFYRVRRAGDVIRGSGLGLFIVRAVVRRHAGRVWLESQPGEPGTSFHLLLPLREAGKKEGAA